MRVVELLLTLPFPHVLLANTQYQPSWATTLCRNLFVCIALAHERKGRDLLQPRPVSDYSSSSHASTRSPRSSSEAFTSSFLLTFFGSSTGASSVLEDVFQHVVGLLRLRLLSSRHPTATRSWSAHVCTSSCSRSSMTSLSSSSSNGRAALKNSFGTSLFSSKYIWSRQLGRCVVCLQIAGVRLHWHLAILGFAKHRCRRQLDLVDFVVAVLQRHSDTLREAASAGLTLPRTTHVHRAVSAARCLALSSGTSGAGRLCVC
jgi:hypothetical protein